MKRKSYVEHILSFITNMQSGVEEGSQPTPVQPDIIEGNDIILGASTIENNAILFGGEADIVGHTVVLA